MQRIVNLPPPGEPLADGARVGGWWHTADESGRLVCDLCPRACHLKPGDRGFCFVRENRDGELVLSTFGRSTGFCIDPIEKKPLNHFYPGTSVLSFGTAGCNLGCKFCQNWDISKSREVRRLSELAMPEDIARAAVELGCTSVAYTYNDPVVWAEYAMETAAACRQAGVKNVAVTAGYLSPAARGPFFEHMDAANVDLKAFTEQFYWETTGSHLQPVLDTLSWLVRETDVWLEVTNLLIPGANDDPEEIRQMCDWLLRELGPDVPLHFTAFHPDFRMRDRPATPPETLLQAHEIARSRGLRYVYVGNVHDLRHQSTYCGHCGELLIARDWYALGAYHLSGDVCQHCGRSVPGRFSDGPGDWGPRRQPVRMADFADLSHPPRTRPAGFSEVDAARSDDARRPAIQRSEAEPAASAAPGSQEAGDAEMTERGSDAAKDSAQGAPGAGHAAGHASGHDGGLFKLAGEQPAELLAAAARWMASASTGRQAGDVAQGLGELAGRPVPGVFVTARLAGQLRGCCGTLGQPQPLGQALAQAATRTAVADPRFPPISPAELPQLELDVTLLSDFQPVTSSGASRVDAVQVGRHGLHIRRGQSSGLLLPSVAVEQGWDAPQFLRQVCRKAGLPAEAWQDPDTELQTFEGHKVSGAFPLEAVGDLPAVAAPVTAAELAQLADGMRRNVYALTLGATPSYYLAGCPDGQVSGLAVSLPRLESSHAADGWSHFVKLALQAGLPMQATLFQLSEAAAEWLRQRALPAELAGRAEVTVLFDPALLGSAAAPLLDGVQPDRALLVSSGSTVAWGFRSHLAPQALLERVLAAADLPASERVAVHSLGVRSTLDQLLFSNAPRPRSGPEVRPPAVAGSFYPSDPQALDQLLDELLDSPPEAPPASWPAAMVPHAGLIYSGRLAAQVLQRLEIPSQVIVIGPNHTGLGVRWAVSPCHRWQLPGRELAGDPALAELLVQHVPGLQLDATAHAREHAIEIELPLLARLAPETRVVGIALGEASWEDCQELGRGLARALLAAGPPQPLLLISSDMNHFADLERTLQLDELALNAMQTGDPQRLYETVSQHEISMCGVRPAVVVMEALRQLQQLDRVVRVGHTTSAEVSGDSRRVVGYAGMLLGPLAEDSDASGAPAGKLA